MENPDGRLRLHAAMRRRLLLYRLGNGRRPDRRIAEHQSGAFPGYTFKRRPVTLAWSEHFERVTDAIAAERQIKGWSRAKKEALVGGDWDSVSRLAARRGTRA